MSTELHVYLTNGMEVNLIILSNSETQRKNYSYQITSQAMIFLLHRIIDGQ